MDAFSRRGDDATRAGWPVLPLKSSDRAKAARPFRRAPDVGRTLDSGLCRPATCSPGAAAAF
jgi:hypothetical protein